MEYKLERLLATYQDGMESRYANLMHRPNQFSMNNDVD